MLKKHSKPAFIVVSHLLLCRFLVEGYLYRICNCGIKILSNIIIINNCCYRVLFLFSHFIGIGYHIAGRLLEKSGVTKAVLDHHGNKDKAGTVMGALLDISPFICKQYLSQRDLNTVHHKETIKAINPLLKELGTDIQL